VENRLVKVGKSAFEICRLLQKSEFEKNFIKIGKTFGDDFFSWSGKEQEIIGLKEMWQLKKKTIEQ